jgi:hypothetical protein
MDNETLSTLGLLVVAGILSLISFILFVRLCGRIKDTKDAFFLVHDLEKAKVQSHHPELDGRYEWVKRIQKKSHSEGPVAA